MRAQLPAWGVFLGGVELGSDQPVQARYETGDPIPNPAPIPPHAPLVVVGSPEIRYPNGVTDPVTPVEWTDGDETCRAWVSTRFIVPSAVDDGG